MENWCERKHLTQSHKKPENKTHHKFALMRPLSSRDRDCITEVMSRRLSPFPPSSTRWAFTAQDLWIRSGLLTGAGTAPSRGPPYLQGLTISHFPLSGHTSLRSTGVRWLRLPQLRGGLVEEYAAWEWLVWFLPQEPLGAEQEEIG